MKTTMYGKDYENKKLWDDYEKHWAEIIAEINKIFSSNKKFAAHMVKVNKEREEQKAKAQEALDKIAKDGIS